MAGISMMVNDPATGTILAYSLDGATVVFRSDLHGGEIGVGVAKVLFVVVARVIVAIVDKHGPTQNIDVLAKLQIAPRVLWRVRRI